MERGTRERDRGRDGQRDRNFVLVVVVVVVVMEGVDAGGGISPCLRRVCVTLRPGQLGSPPGSGQSFQCFHPVHNSSLPPERYPICTLPRQLAPRMLLSGCMACLIEQTMGCGGLWLLPRTSQSRVAASWSLSSHSGDFCYEK